MSNRLTASETTQRDSNPTRRLSPGFGVTALFSTTLFLSAALMFLVQPMFAKLTLPLLGSTPAVWNSAMLFFQTALLAGYVYAHESTHRLGVRRQAALHLGVVLVPLLVLPIGLPQGWSPPQEGSVVPWLLGLLALGVGLPFFVVSTTAPLLQRWLAGTSHPAAADPYFLYRASNLGSVIGLLGYPLAMEPALRLAEQARLWSAGYLVFAALVLACAAATWRTRPPAAPSDPSAPASLPVPSASASAPVPDPAAPEPPRAPSRPSSGRRLRWVGLAFVPSSLMLGLTETLTTDIAPVPLLWVMPLSLYLISFILVFSPGTRTHTLHRWMVLALPWVVLGLSGLLLLDVTGPLWLVLPLHLAGFFVAAVVCHGELARTRPAPRWLTELYLLIALGGALGGVFNAIVAPALFDSLSEYPLAIVLAALCLPRRPPQVPPGPYARWLDLGLPLTLGAAVALALALVGLASADAQSSARGLAFGVAAGLVLNLVRRPLRFGLAVGAIVLSVGLTAGSDERELYQQRSFFGVYRVSASPDGGLRRLVRGSTIHGAQDLTPARERTPLSYYHPSTPIGGLLRAMAPELTARVAVIGLGTGSIACYSRPGERWTFFEIDPQVERIARDPRLFTYLDVCRGDFDVVLGDARLSLASAPERRYGLIVADAFSSNAPPIHLLTREALALYRSKLLESGVLALNVSNRYLDLEPVLGGLAREARLACIAAQDLVSEEDGRPETDPSDWVVIARRERTLTAVADRRWRHCRRSPGARVWTDDFSNPLGALDIGL